ncbi:MAG TPA: MFS transporter, partial [Gaiellaceae bacterium]|nr:MFS transporter [Gaiellaceae bacterium]
RAREPETRLLHRLMPNLSLVRGNPSFRRLFVAALGSGVGTWFATVALSIDVFDRTGSTTWVGALLIANLVPTIVVGFLLGSLVDRLKRRRLMVGSDLVRFAVFAAMPFVGSATAIVALALVAGVATAFFRPAVLAGLPNTVAEHELAHANGLLQSADFLTTAIGPVLGAVLVSATDPGTAYLVNAASFLFSAALLVGIPWKLLQSEQSLSRGHLTDMKEGLQIVLRSPALLTVLVTFTIVMVPAAFLNVAEIALAKRSLDAGSIGFGLLWTASGIGMVAGSTAAGRILERLGPRVVYPLSIAWFALGMGATGVAPDIWVALATMVLSGFGNGVVVVTNITLVQNGAPDRLRGRAFTTIISTNYVVSGLAMAGAGPLTAWHGARWTYEIGAAVMAAAALVGVALARRIPDAPPPEIVEAALEIDEPVSVPV